MKADYSSHLLRRPIAFELFLFSYLVCALCLQNINIYKTNVHLIDFNLLLFTVAILLRRPAWCALTQLQAHYMHWSTTKSTGLKSRFHLKKTVVVLCTVLVIVWSAIELVSNTSLFNLLFLFYPLLLYLSLFGFTLEPRVNRSRFQPPKRFLEDSISPTRRPQIFQYTLPPSITSSFPTHLAGSPPATGTMSFFAEEADDSSTDSKTSQTSDQTSQTDNQTSSATAYFFRTPNSKYTWEYALLLPVSPDVVRREVEILISDLIVRLKQLLFNSLFCAYYVGFIPMQFADSHLFYNKWWCMEHAFLVWANSFVILSTFLLPPSYCQLLYQCSLHLGCWTRCAHNETHSVWSPHIPWPNEAVVQLNGESFKAEGLQNVAIPCDTSQEVFYILFSSRHHVHSWLLAMQSVLIALQVLVLLRSIYWHQLLSMSVLLSFNCYILYVLLYNRLRCRQTLVLN